MFKRLNTHLTLKNYYNVTNSTNLATDLIHLVINKNHGLITYDVKELYVNILIEETTAIIKSVLTNNNETRMTKKQIITLLRLPLSEN